MQKYNFLYALQADGNRNSLNFANKLTKTGLIPLTTILLWINTGVSSDKTANAH